MTARIRPDGEGYAAAAPDLRDRALEAAQLDRVEFVIGKINGKQRRIDQAQAGGRVVISRSIELPEHVIGLFHLQRLFGDTPDMVVRIGRTCECATQTDLRQFRPEWGAQIVDMIDSGVAFSRKRGAT